MLKTEQKSKLSGGKRWSVDSFSTKKNLTKLKATNLISYMACFWYGNVLLRRLQKQKNLLKYAGETGVQTTPFLPKKS